MTRWTRIMLGAAFGFLPFALTLPAFADDGCPSLDVTCVADGVTSDVRDTVDGSRGPVDETAPPLVEQILDEVDEILGGGVVVEPPSRGGEHGIGPGDDLGGGASRPASGDREGPRPLRDRARTSSAHRGAPVPTTDSSQVPLGPRPDDLPGTIRRGGIGRVIAGAAGSAIVVLALAGIILAFVLIQDRLDRNDPRLALAPIRPDVLRFE
jgi:hypothetical protein